MQEVMLTSEIPTDYDELRRAHISLLRENKILETFNKEMSKRYNFHIRKLRDEIFAASSEQIIRLELPLFNEAELLDEISSALKENEALSEAALSEDVTYTPAKTGTKKKKGRSALPKELPREIVTHDLSEEEKVCANDGGPLHKIGEEVSEELHYTPAKLKVIRHITPKYGCRVCEETVLRADKPEKLIPKSNATSGLLASISIEKYVNHNPLYRQEQSFKRLGVDLSRTTLASWMIRLGEALQPLVNLMMEDLQDGDVLHCDETRIRVLKRDGTPSEAQAYFWAIGRWLSDQKIIVFNYDRSRSLQVPRRLLSGFKGYLCTDGYNVYDALCANSPDIIKVGCLAHIRRKFVEFIKTLPKESRSEHPASIIVSKIGKLFKIESEIKDLSYDKKHDVRQSVAKPIYEELEDFVAKEHMAVLTTSPYGKALAYAAKELCHNKNYLRCGKVEISNNFVENAIRPLALGRKNWLFADSEKGANASANIYSVLITAKYNNKDLYSYVTYLIDELPKCKTASDYEALLPY